MILLFLVQVILFDVESGRNFLSPWREELWRSCKIGIPDSDSETLNTLIFGGLVAWFLGKVCLRILLLKNVSDWEFI